MKRILHLNRSFLLLMIIIPLMTLVSLWLYIQFLQTNEDTFKVLKKHLLNDRIELFQNYANFVQKNASKNFQISIINSPKIAQKFENELALLKDSETKYLYLLYKDSNKKWRYLIDATQEKEEKSFCQQKFDPQSDIWDKALQTQKVQITEQKSLETLWISMAYPIVVKGKVVAVIGADFTQSVYDNVKNRLKPMEEMFLYIDLFMIIMLFLAYLLIYMYYNTRKKSFIDPLTKVYNRQYLQEFLQHNSLQNYYLMMVDLDHFKLLNDNYGHDAGDVVLMSVVMEMKRSIRQQDFIVRFGGEEFLLFIDKKDIQDVKIVAERVRQRVEELSIQTKNNTLNVTLSIGINPFPYRFKNIDEAVKIADEQLYIAKSSGRNRIAVYSADGEYKSQTSQRISDIQEAVDEKRIKCAFQPIYANNDTEILKYEMLLRLFDKENNIVPPDSFLPYVRNTQVYISLTRIVIDTAIEALENHEYNLSLNLDLQDLLNDDIMQLLQDKFVNKTDLANRLTIEVLEHEGIKDFALIKSKIDVLKALGLSIALDDFGSGYANFSYLLNLELDILKIDGSIIQEVNVNEAAYQVVKTICSFAKGMNMKTVAEQIETKEVLDVLQELEVDYFQGYYLGRPAFEFTDPFSSK